MKIINKIYGYKDNQKAWFHDLSSELKLGVMMIIYVNYTVLSVLTSGIVPPVKTAFVCGLYVLLYI